MPGVTIFEWLLVIKGHSVIAGLFKVDCTKGMLWALKWRRLTSRGQYEGVIQDLNGSKINCR
jgi:hypothetical protein